MISSPSLPYLLPNEHLISGLVRWFNHTGLNEFRRTCSPYFQNISTLSPMAAWRPLYSEIAQIYRHTLSPQQLLSQHSLLNYYYPFFLTEERAIADEQLLLNHLDIKIQPGLQKHLRHAHHWRWCSQCVSDDVSQFGGPYWHTYHQIPTMLHCYRHGEVLLAGCESCGFRFTSFDTHWLPPDDSQCPVCQTELKGQCIPLTGTVRWLESVSYALQREKAEITREKFLSWIHDKLGYHTLPSIYSLALRKKLSRLRLEFTDSLDDELLSLYFREEPSRLRGATQKLLNIIWVAYRGTSVPPISLLLMLRHLGLEHQLTCMLTEQ